MIYMTASHRKLYPAPIPRKSPPVFATRGTIVKTEQRRNKVIVSFFLPAFPSDFTRRFRYGSTTNTPT